MRKAGTKKLWITSSEVSVSFTGTPDRHVQLVDLALAGHVLDLPHPVLADHVDLHRVLGRHARHGEEELRAPDEDRPSTMPSGMSVQVSSSASEPWMAGGRSSSRAAAVADGEDDDQGRDEQRRRTR